MLRLQENSLLRLNRMTDYAIVVLGALAHRRGEVLATAQLAALTGLAQPTVAKVAKHPEPWATAKGISFIIVRSVR